MTTVLVVKERRLIIKRSLVWIPVRQIIEGFFTSICGKNVLFVCLKQTENGRKRGRAGTFLKKISAILSSIPCYEMKIKFAFCGCRGRSGVTRFGEILPLWQKIKSIWAIFMSFICILQFFLPNYSENLFMLLGKFT